MWPFFWSGYVSAGAGPMRVKFVTFSSNFWPLAGEAWRVPVTEMEAPVEVVGAAAE